MSQVRFEIEGRGITTAEDFSQFRHEIYELHKWGLIHSVRTDPRRVISCLALVESALNYLNKEIHRVESKYNEVWGTNNVRC